MWCVMTNDLIKVDRVRSVAEAAAVRQLGAGLVGVALGPDPRFADDRVVTVDQAASIGRALGGATLVAIMDLDSDPDPVRRIVVATGAGLVQPLTGAIPPADVRAALRAADIGIVYAGIEIAHDDDPSWILSRYAEVPDLDAALFQVDVLPEYRDSWRFLRDESPAYEDEFQVGDLDRLGGQHDLLATFDFSAGNVAEIVAALPAVRGIALTIADRPARDDVHWLTYAQVLAVLGGRS
jgi:hypothetical protein